LASANTCLKVVLMWDEVVRPSFTASSVPPLFRRRFQSILGRWRERLLEVERGHLLELALVVGPLPRRPTFVFLLTEKSLIWCWGLHKKATEAASSHLPATHAEEDVQIHLPEPWGTTRGSRCATLTGRRTCCDCIQRDGHVDRQVQTGT